MKQLARDVIRTVIARGDRIRCTSEDELEKIMSALDGLAVHVTIQHDDVCTPARCACSPHYVLERLTVETYATGQTAQRRWIQDTTS